ncbi:cupin domain-containing protein [Pararobbsia silviterrae]|nr:cupin domain-containing protein [Pararobbsia silviterrae]
MRRPARTREGGDHMGLNIRRVITGHDASLKAVVVDDATMAATISRPGQEVCVVWASDCVPADNLDPADGATRSTEARIANGASFRIVRYDAGCSGRMHRTQTLDYGLVVAGAIVLELDDGVEVALAAGDVLVQRGTIHRWSNRGDEACTVAFVLIDALPIVFEDGAAAV